MRVHISKATRVAAAAMIAMAAASTAAQAQELLLNGNFEAGAEGDGAANWTTYNFTFTTGEQAHTPAGKSFKAYGPFFQVGQGSVGLQSVAVTPGTAYTLTGFMFSPTSDHVNGANFGILELHYLDASNALIPGSAVQEQLTATSPADVWNSYTITKTAPANAAKAEVVIGHIQQNNPFTGGAVFWDDLSLKAAVVVTSSTWISSSGGGWLTASNWQDANVPNAVGATANFGSSITAPSTVTVAGAGVTAGTINFNNATNAYTIGGSAALTLDVASGSAALNVTAGSHAINAPLVVNDNTVANVATGQTLTVGGALTLAAGTQLSATGAGTLRINTTSVTGAAGAAVVANGGTVQADVDLGANVDLTSTAGQIVMSASQHVRSLNVASGAKATLSDVATSRVIRTPSLTVATGGTLNLGDNYAIIEYTGTSPAAAIRAGIQAGIAGGNVGTGIISSKVVSDSKYAIGYAEASAIPARTTFAGETGYDNTTLLVRVTLKGDADLSGNVNFDDLIALAQNYNGVSKVWSQGDFNYDNTVNFDDLIPLAQNYNASAANLGAAGFSAGFASDWALAQSLVPEPTTLAAALGAASVMLRRSRRSAR